MTASQTDKSETLTHPSVTSPTPVYESGQLFGAAKEVLIRHAGEVYRLRVTRLNKLILTK